MKKLPIIKELTHPAGSRWKSRVRRLLATAARFWVSARSTRSQAQSVIRLLELQTLSPAAQSGVRGTLG